MNNLLQNAHIHSYKAVSFLCPFSWFSFHQLLLHSSEQNLRGFPLFFCFMGFPPLEHITFTKIILRTSLSIPAICPVKECFLQKFRTTSLDTPNSAAINLYPNPSARSLQIFFFWNSSIVFPPFSSPKCYFAAFLSINHIKNTKKHIKNIKKHLKNIRFLLLHFFAYPLNKPLNHGLYSHFTRLYLLAKEKPCKYYPARFPYIRRRPPFAIFAKIRKKGGGGLFIARFLRFWPPWGGQKSYV